MLGKSVTILVSYCHMLTDFQNSVTDRLSSEFVVQELIRI